MKTNLQKLVSWLGNGWGDANDLPRRAIVLCYHSIHPVKSFASATPELFEQHLYWLKQRCEVVTFRRILEELKRNGRNCPAVAITFDDGYADNYEYAFPLLQKYAIPATFFVTVGLLEKDPTVVHRFQMLRQSGYEDVRPLEWSQVRQMREAGMEIGTHTYSHPNLARLGPSAVQVELNRSKQVMEQRLGEPIVLMAYPFGKPKRHFTAETVSLVAAAGYEYAAAVLFRTVRPSDSKLSLPRLCVARDELETLKSKVYGAWDFLGWWQENVPLWVAKVTSPKDSIR